MPIFGQVWLWSLLAFLLGVLLCWLVAALPARRRVVELTRRMSALRADARRDAGSEARPAEHGTGTGERYPVGALVPGFPDVDDYSDEPSRESLTRAYAVRSAADEAADRERGVDTDAGRRGSLSLSDNAIATGMSDLTGVIGQRGALPGNATGSRHDLVGDPDTSDSSEPGAAEVTSYIPTTRSAEAPGGKDWFDAEQDAGSTAKVPSQTAPESDRLVDDSATSAEPEDAPAEGPAAAVETADQAGEDSGTIFTQRTMPIPVDLIRRLDGLDDEQDTPDKPDEPEGELVDDLAEEQAGGQPAAEPGTITGEVATEVVPPAEEPAAVAAEPVEAATPSELVEPAKPAEPSEAAEPERTEKVAVAPSSAQAVTETLPRQEPERTEKVEGRNVEALRGLTVQASATSPLPKRIPNKSQRARHPFGVQPSTPAIANESQPTRSLFEPILPAADDQQAVPPPPHRARTEVASRPGIRPTPPQPSRSPGSPGPFGPGSAMPLPGGASPSPEFTVKASVTALRYCTPDSALFGRTVAEVWFRSASDAERVGFRPV